MTNIPRCPWCQGDALYTHYHDHEWGKPLYDSDALFALLCLESMQAGLSWITILKKRDNFYRALDNFDARLIADYDTRKIDTLMHNAGIIRNRKKIEAVIQNARCYLSLQKSLAPQSFGEWLWQVAVCGTPIINHPTHPTDVPARTEHSDLLASTLKQHGFKFIGSTICYAFMQACGMVNDHLVSCHFKYSPNPTASGTTEHTQGCP